VKVLVDTDVWSEALRKKSGTKSKHVGELSKLIEEGRVTLIGPLRMEILNGIRDTKIFDKLRKRLEAYPDRTLDSSIYVLAAKFFNLCRSKGIQGSNTDFILCACSVDWKIPILTKDKDFVRYQKYLPIELQSLRP
jgi:hypothetical protein